MTFRSVSLTDVVPEWCGRIGVQQIRCVEEIVVSRKSFLVQELLFVNFLICQVSFPR